jgi:hypothetical protein
MNIYIKPELEKLLRQEDSMSGLINQLLMNHYLNARIDNTRDQLTGPPKKIANEPRYVNEDDGAPETDLGTPRTGLEPLYRNKKKGKI